jgi:hypothetical protein
MDCNRSFKRYRTRAYCAVYNRTDDRSMGCLVDLSVSGLQIMGEDKLSIGKEYKLKIQMHKPIDDSRDLIFDAECFWSKKSVDPQYYISGFKLTNIDENMVKRIKIFTHTSVFQYPQTQKIDIR